MKAYEVRIGSWVLDIAPFMIQAKHLDGYKPGDTLPFQGINITPPLLKKIGLIRNGDSDSWEFPFETEYMLIKLTNGYYEINHREFSVVGIKKFKYVHQLQNAIQVIDGIDYKIDLT